MSGSFLRVSAQRVVELRSIYAQLDRVIAAAGTASQRRAAWAARDHLTASLIRCGWLTREIAETLGRSQSTVSTWASRGREDAGSWLNLPLPPGAAKGLTPADEFVGVAAAAKIMSVDKHTIRNWIRAGRLAAHRPDRHGAAWRIARREIEEFQQTKQGESVSEIAAWYCVAEGTVRRWMHTGRLERERVNRRGFFGTARDDLQ